MLRPNLIEDMEPDRPLEDQNLNLSDRIEISQQRDGGTNHYMSYTCQKRSLLEGQEGFSLSGSMIKSSNRFWLRFSLSLYHKMIYVGFGLDKTSGKIDQNRIQGFSD